MFGIPFDDLHTAILIGIFAAGLVMLIKGGDWFVDGATGIAKRFHIPELLIGATVVSIGTTLPEIMVSATSAAQGYSEMAYGNAIGSVICNTALISALTVAIRPTSVDRKTFRTPVIFFFIAAVFYAVIAYTTGYFSRLTGIILLLIFIIYMSLTVWQAFREKNKTPELLSSDKPSDKPSDKAQVQPEKASPVWKDLLGLAVGAALIALGAQCLVNSGTVIAERLNVPQSVIALTFVALGTSLPELVTAITSLIKGHSSLSLGNIIGANLFNLVLVSGLSTTISPFDVPASKTISGMNASLIVDIPVMFAVMLILTLPSLIRGKLSRIQGIALLAIYAGFCVFQFLF